MATITSKLSKKMAACKLAQADTLKDLAVAGRLATKKHDQAVTAIQELDRQIEADPDNAELHTRRDEYDRVRAGLNAAIEYGRGLHEQVIGTPRTVPQDEDRHNIKDPAGKFAKKNSIGHRLMRMLTGK